MPIFSIARSALALAGFMIFGSAPAPEHAQKQNCVPGATAFQGYSFLEPLIVQENAAYAPFLVRWSAYYQDAYFRKDLQRQDNINEWRQRFCTFALPADVDYVVYEANMAELGYLRSVAGDPKKQRPLPASLAGNTFAEILAENSCTEAVDYLMYTRKCEPYVIRASDEWEVGFRDTASMNLLMQEGLGRFRNTESHFFRLRYAYQIVRLAHYSRNWQNTVDLYNFLMPKVDRREPSIIFFWTLGHLAGAMQQLGQYPEAAYRYALIFRHCRSKRIQAFRSFAIRNDQEWTKSVRLCQTDAEKATLHILRAGNTKQYAIEDLRVIYELDPANPQLELLVVSDIQELEKIFLRTPVTDRKYGVVESTIRRANAAQHLLDLQAFTRQVIREGHQADPALWRGLNGYLLLLGGDYYAAGKEFDRAESLVDKSNEQGKNLDRQIEIWRLLLEILTLDPASEYADQTAFRIRSYDLFRSHPDFEPFLRDWMSERYIALHRPGKAALMAYGFKALAYNPNPAVIDDLLLALEKEDVAMVEALVEDGASVESAQARLLEMKAVQLFNTGKPEAALVTLRSIRPTELEALPKFSPFKEIFDERVNRPVSDTLLLNRAEIVERLFDYELCAKGAEAINDPVGAWYYYLLGIAHYNMSFFGYEWEAMDFYRNGYNWLRLPQGPVFPLSGSPAGNWENTDVGRALYFFDKALNTTISPELAAKAAFMAARCQQKQFFTRPGTTYRPGSKLIPILPETHRRYYDLLKRRYGNTKFYQEIVKECRWLAVY